LFTKLWPKLLEAAATEAVGESVKDKESPAAPEANEISGALAKVEVAEPESEKVAGGNVLIRHEKPGYLTFDTTGKVKGQDIRIHRNVLAVTEQEMAAFKQSATPQQRANQSLSNRQVSGSNRRNVAPPSSPAPQSGSADNSPPSNQQPADSKAEESSPPKTGKTRRRGPLRRLFGR
jgi:hypothetical protein